MADEKKDDISELESKEAAVDIGPDGWQSLRRIRWQVDNFYSRLKDYLKSNIMPQGLSKDARKRFRRWTRDFFHYEPESDEIVLYTTTAPPEESYRGEDIFKPSVIEEGRTFHYIVANPEIHKDIILSLYNSAEAGFTGVEALYRTIRSKYIGITRKTVMLTLRNLEVKQLGRSQKTKTISPIITTFPMELVQADLMDMSNQFPHLNLGYSYILNIACHFSKFLLASVPLKSKKMSVVVAEIEKCFQTFGPPSTLQTDNGSEFVNEYMFDLADRMGFKFYTPPPYHSSTNGFIESTNKTVRVFAESWMVQNDSKMWVDRLQIFRYNYNMKPHTSHGFTPHSVMFRRTHKHPVDLIVHRRIKQNALRMIKKSSKKGRKVNLSPLQIGDSVRIDTSAVGKKLTDFAIKAKRRRKELFRFSKDIYKVTRIITHELSDRPPFYRVNYTKDPDKTWHRNELFKVDPDAVIRPDQYKPFVNSQMYDREAALRSLASNRKAVEDRDMSEKDNKEEAKIEEMVAEKRVLRPRKSKRVSKQRVLRPRKSDQARAPLAARSLNIPTVKKEFEEKEAPNLADLSLSQSQLRRLKNIKRIENFPGSIFNQPGLVYSASIVKIVKSGRHLGKVQVRMDDDNKLWYFSADQIIAWSKFSEDQASRYRRAD